MNDSRPDDETNEPQRFALLQAIHDHAVDAIITIDERSMILSCNPATESMFGYSAAELIGEKVTLLMPTPHRQQHDRYVSDYMHTGIRKIIGIGREVAGQRKDGSIFPIHLAVSEIVVGEERRFAGVIRDLTEFKQLEARETLLGRIIEESLNEIYVIDAESLRFLEANRGARRNLGRSMEELRSMTLADIIPDLDTSTLRQSLASLDEVAQPRLKLDSQFRRADGTGYFVEVFLQSSQYQGQAAYVAIALDVTERRRAETELQRQRDAMQTELEQLCELRTRELRQAQAELVRAEKFSTLGKVAGGIAHEIRNPLNAVKMSAYFLLNSKHLTEEKTKEHLQRIDRQVSLVDNVITALSDVAKLPEAKLQPVGLFSLIKSAVASIDLPGNVELVYSPKLSEIGNNLQVLADSNQLLIALKNLFRNARDAVGDQGVIKVDVQFSSDTVRLSIGDDGVGMDQETIERMMEPLFTTKARGMGLGLPITQAIIEKHQGKLTVESRLGEGSVFTLSLMRVPGQ